MCDSEGSFISAPPLLRLAIIVLGKQGQLDVRSRTRRMRLHVQIKQHRHIVCSCSARSLTAASQVKRLGRVHSVEAEDGFLDVPQQS